MRKQLESKMLDSERSKMKEALTPLAEDSTWSSLPISFTIDPQGFTPEQSAVVEENFRNAAADWEGICGAQFLFISFENAAQNADFAIVAGSAADEDSARFVSTAFIGPNGDGRQIRIMSTFFSTSLSTQGVCRHELGHVLGFVHEHNDLLAPSNCTRDDPLPESHDLSPYDRRSVMHYFCGSDGGTPEFNFTESDIQGARTKYP